MKSVILATVLASIASAAVAHPARPAEIVIPPAIKHPSEIVIPPAKPIVTRK
jgi:hypothetical protein